MSRRRADASEGRGSPLEGELRRQLIVERIHEHGRVRVADLKRLAGVTEITIRRDLEELERVGSLRRVRGGAVPALSGSYEPPFTMRLSMRTAEKRRIGTVAAGLVADGDTVIIDAGTTSMELAQALVGRTDLTVATPSLRIAEVLRDQPGIRLLVTGGFVRAGEWSLVGEPVEQTFKAFRFDTAFLTIGGVDLVAGLTEYNVDDARVKRAALGSATRTVTLADSTKLGKVAFARVCGTDGFDVLVTDTDAPGAMVAGLETAGVEVIQA